MSLPLVRLIEKKDIDAVAECERNTFSDASSRGAIETLFDMGATGVVAECEGNICGYAYCADAVGDAELLRIAVLPDFRRKGIGASLLSELHVVLKKKGMVGVFLEVRESNFSARALYKSFGYHEDGKRRNFYSNPKEDAILMSKDLSPLLME